MANLPTDMELELAESHRNATRTPSPQLTPCEQLKYSKAQLAKTETFRRCKQACVDALMMRCPTTTQMNPSTSEHSLSCTTSKNHGTGGTHFNNLENSGPVANENQNGSNNSASQNTPQNQLPPPIMLFVEKNYKANGCNNKSIPPNKIPPNG
ncbi:hypothetical protein TNCV_1488261 [Trichonephila clavipes]|nr:hypothetical protein TNCV_1488261 [Trichonephila clavipes]